MILTDTHCHIHSSDYPLPVAEVEARAAENNVDYLICVGTDVADSELAVEFVQNRKNHWASVGQHPHEAKYGVAPLVKLRALLEAQAGEAKNGSEKPGHAKIVPSDASSTPFLVPPKTVGTQEGAERRRQGAGKIVAVGECGLDYFYGHSSKEDQEKALRYQMELALEYDLPLIFHVRDAFDDFWPIFDSYPGLRGVLHSYTDNQINLNKALERGLYVGVNGIMTFTKNDWQLEVARAIPLEKIVLETDAPFLTPAPIRGKVNEPANVMLTARFMSELRHVSVEELANLTTTNARHLFSL